MSNYPEFSVVGDEGSVAAQIGDNTMLQGVGFPLRKVQQVGGAAPYPGPATVLAGGNTNDQIPTGAGVPLAVSFGAAQSAPEASLAANGVVTFNTTAVYMVTINVNFQRGSNAGVARMFGRALVNGAQFGGTVCAEMNDADESVFYQVQFIRPFTAGDTLAVQVVRDPTGNNDGFLSAVPAPAGWTPSASAGIRVDRF